MMLLLYYLKLVLLQIAEYLFLLETRAWRAVLQTVELKTKCEAVDDSWVFKWIEQEKKVEGISEVKDIWKNYKVIKASSNY